MAAEASEAADVALAVVADVALVVDDVTLAEAEWRPTTERMQSLAI